MSVLACKHKLVCRLQGSLVVYTRHYPEQLHCAHACMHDRSRGLCVAHVYTMHKWSLFSFYSVPTGQHVALICRTRCTVATT